MSTQKDTTERAFTDERHLGELGVVARHVDFVYRDALGRVFQFIDVRFGVAVFCCAVHLGRRVVVVIVGLVVFDIVRRDVHIVAHAVVVVLVDAVVIVVLDRSEVFLISATKQKNTKLI